MYIGYEGGEVAQSSRRAGQGSEACQAKDEIRIEAEDRVDVPLHNACTGGGCLPISASISRKVCVWRADTE